MKDLHTSQAQEKAKCLKEAAEKEARKAAEASCNAQIQKEIKTRIFTGA